MKQTEPKSYQKALTELQELVQTLQQEELDIDRLTETVQRARYLIDYCQTRLRQVDEELKGFLE